MAEDKFTIPQAVKKYIKDQGYRIDERMVSSIQAWWNWYRGTDSWYQIDYTMLDGTISERTRLSLRPHKRAAREWASLLLNEDTLITAETEGANTWLQDYLESHSFWPTGQTLIEKAFGLGTGAWALWFDIREGIASDIKLRRYDARMTIPLTWDDDGVQECAFVSNVTHKGKTATQLQMHVLGEGGKYVIKTAFFIGNRKVDADEDIIEEFPTDCDTPTFALVKPGIENTVVDFSPYGMSIFADALDACKSVDLTYDALFQEIELTEAIVFMAEEMIDVRDKNGKAVPVPKEESDRKFRKLEGQDGSNLYEVYSPEIRTGPIKEAFDVALAEFGDQTGFGQEYFTLDKQGGLKTATEVVSDNACLMRNIKKHENSIRGSIQTIVASLLTCAKKHSMAGAEAIEEDFGNIGVAFDDSIITDTQAEKNQMLAEIAAGVLPKWKYLVKFYGMSEEEAKAMLPQETFIDKGY